MKLSALIILVLVFVSCGQTDAPRAQNHEPGVWVEGDLSDPVEFYKQRYSLSDTHSKLVSNYGKGHDDLYGVRNFRVVLHGLVYRGGANNLYHKKNKRDNRNPLPEDGLENLCKEDFGVGVYLYTTRYSTASPEKTCTNIHGETNKLTYLQKSPFGDSQVEGLIKMVYENIQTYKYGPMYFHCWNGWHASGLISALLLRQFCSVSPEDAVKYWDNNTDGVNRDRAYEKHRRRIRNFTPLKNYQVNQATQAIICPTVL